MVRQVLLPDEGDRIIEEKMCFGKSHSKAPLGGMDFIVPF